MECQLVYIFIGFLWKGFYLQICKMTNPLLQAIDELKKEEDLKKKKRKPALTLPKEKRLQYYSGWHKDDKPVTKEEGEKQKKLC